MKSFAIVRIVIVAVVAFGLFKLVQIQMQLNEKQAEIDALYTKAEDAKVLAEQQQAEYAEKLEIAYAAGEQIVKEAVARGQNREEEILRKANQEAAAILDKAAADIAQEKKKAINEAKDEISGIAMDIAGKVVGRALSQEDQARLVDSFIRELGEEV